MAFVDRYLSNIKINYCNCLKFIKNNLHGISQKIENQKNQFRQKDQECNNVINDFLAYANLR